MSSTTIGYTKDGKAIHRLVEWSPLRFWAPRQRPTPRRTREAVAVDDFGIVSERRSPAVKPRPDLTHLLDVPLVGGEFSYGSARIGVEVGLDEYGNPLPRRGSGGHDLTRLLETEGGVPLRRKKPSSLPFALQGAEAAGEGAEDEEEDFAAEDGEGDEGDEDGEPEEDPEDAWASFVQEVSESTDTAAKGLALLAQALRQRRAAVGAAGGLFD